MTTVTRVNKNATVIVNQVLNRIALQSAKWRLTSTR